jgi:hypothetical protein
MNRRTALTALTVVAAAAPAAAIAAPADGTVELRGAPTLRLVAGAPDRATLRFATDEALPRRADGAIQAQVRFSDQGATSIGRDGRHGRDRTYVSYVRSARTLTVGRRYTVRIVVDGQAAIVRQVKLHGARR